MLAFRKLYYKIVTLICLVSTFVFVFSMDKTGVGYGCFYIIVGLLSFGSLSIGKEEFDADKPIRNILLLLAWSLLGFSIMAMGIMALIEMNPDESIMTVFLVLAGLGLIVVYIISIIKNKDYFAILSILLVVAGFVCGGLSGDIMILRILTLVLLAGSLVSFVVSIIKGFSADY